MLGLMQSRQLLISSIIEHAATYHPKAEVVSRTLQGDIHRSNYATINERSKKLANALKRLGVKPGDRVATLAWNGYRHMELYFAVSGMGAILHTINPRLFPAQIDYIINHAEDKLIFFDLTFAPLLEQLAPSCPGVEKFVALADAATMPKEKIPNLLCYETLVEAENADFVWPQFDENTASSLCYTSGTTGNPKGVLYSHRSTVLHSMTACMSDGLGLTCNDSVFLIVPLFHVNAWGVPYASAMCGAKLVLPGNALDGKSVYDLLVAEQCNFSLGVPTVWQMFLAYIDANPSLNLKDIKLERVVVGGSAAPRAMIEKFYELFDAFTIHAWGMSETSPLASIGQLLPKHRDLPLDKKVDVQVKQGRGIYGVELKIVNDNGEELPRDGKAFGDLKVRGPWVTSGYFKGESGDVLDSEGWFTTGDVATLDPDGYVQITDRSKDVIKSGGEWISSIDIENIAVGHPDVLQAAVIGVHHDKWQERPLLLVIRKPGSTVEGQAILDYLAPRLAKWWMPDDVVFINEIPLTATGKIQKRTLREQFKDYRLPTQ